MFSLQLVQPGLFFGLTLPSLHLSSSRFSFGSFKHFTVSTLNWLLIY
jgi:hypothetical protein